MKEGILPKPKIGEPCNGCGLCCMVVMCNVGAYLMKKTNVWGERKVSGPCPALVKKPDGMMLCGLVLTPEKYVKSKYRPEVVSREVSHVIGAGTGCDDLGIDEEIDPEEEQKLDAIIDAHQKDTVWIERSLKAIEILTKVRND